jgi:hypothetical protein
MAEAITRPANQEWAWLLGAILSDGIVGPIRLMIGLARTDASAAALLLTLEGVPCWLGLSLGKTSIGVSPLGMACLVAEAMILSWSAQPSLASLQADASWKHAMGSVVGGASARRPQRLYADHQVHGGPRRRLSPGDDDGPDPVWCRTTGSRQVPDPDHPSDRRSHGSVCQVSGD